MRVSVHAVAHVQDGGLARAGTWVDHVDQGTALARELNQRGAKGSKRRERMGFQTRLTI